MLLIERVINAHKQNKKSSECSHVNIISLMEVRCLYSTAYIAPYSDDHHIIEVFKF